MNTTPLEILDIADILPTTKEVPQSANSLPTVPMISDTLFDLLDDSLDSGYSEAWRVRTGRSGNVLLIVVDSSGIFEMEVLFCACSDKKPAQEQLLKSCLFPATFKQIETVFSFRVLDNFLVDNLECKTTAQQYFSKLQSMTSSMFPDNVPVCSMYAHMVNLNQLYRTNTSSCCRPLVNGTIFKIG